MKEKYKINDTVIVNNGVHNEQFDVDISGYVGTIIDIIDIGELTYQIEWDAITLNNIDFESAEYLAVNVCDWDFTFLHASKFKKTDKRCTERKTKQAVNAINKRFKNKS